MMLNLNEVGGMKEFQATKQQISLHGLGFLQVILPNNQRIHVWHPDLPKRKCFEHSSIHDHRFGFVSKVLRGIQINQLYRERPFHQWPEAHRPSHIAYLHEGERTEFGNRPWIRDHACVLEAVGKPRIIQPGEQYEMNPYMLHATQCEGVTVTLMTKTHAEDQGSMSYCDAEVDPDVDFDRHQLSEDRMWVMFLNAMRDSKGIES